jgi:hypothetical protein
MKIRSRLQTVLLVVFILVAGSAYGQIDPDCKPEAYNQPIEVLAQDVFEARFGDNPQIPRSHEAIIALAERLYPPLTKKAGPAAPPEETGEDCGEDDVGVLFAALKNPAVSDVTRRIVNEIIAAAIPPLPKIKVSDSGHFKICYTTSNTNKRHNVTEAQIDNLATHLDSYWELYAKARDPKHKIVDGKKRIDVKVYYINDKTLGQTESDWDHIELNSKLCVRNTCKRRTTSAHELFHRVQYAYGYESGTANMKWIVEGTAVWSQKFTNPGLRDYMFWMNKGLGSPKKALITERSYDAAHFWVHIDNQYFWAIQDVWAIYEVNGKDAKAAVNTVTTAEFDRNFDSWLAIWSSANYMKDLTNAAAGYFDYDENAVTKFSCGEKYGPLRKVPVTTRAFYPQSSHTLIGSVKPYGADYFVFTPLRTTKEYLLIRFQGTGSYTLSFINIKNNNWISYSSGPIQFPDEATSHSVSGCDKLVLVVMGTTTGGNYKISVQEDPH